MKVFDWSVHLDGYYACGVAMAVADTVEQARNLLVEAYKVSRWNFPEHYWQQYCAIHGEGAREKVVDDDTRMFRRQLENWEPKVHALPYAFYQSEVS